MAPAAPLVLDLSSAAGIRWTLQALSDVPHRWRSASDEQPATVPGEVYADLLSAGVIPDPFDADNEAALSWIGRTRWRYATTFDWTLDDVVSAEGVRRDLVVEGLDTVATIRLNGTELARTANQHRSYRFEASALLLEGPNALEVDFEGPVPAAERLSAELVERPHVERHPFNALRKMASAYGWDWGPDLAGAGIWRPMRLESWSGVRLAAVRPLARLEGADGVLDVHADLEWAGESDDPVTLRVAVGGQSGETSVEPGQPSAHLQLRVPEVRRWWPRDYGEQARYPVEVTLGGMSWRTEVGFRNVTLSTAPDEDGTEFVLAVNGQPVYVRGANWIPDDPLLTRLTPERYRRSLSHAVDAGINLLRVWGGGIYESEDFYAACDELGLLVWQDFLFACAAYSEEEPLRTEVEAEAREAVTRLSRHPSLALWNGNNENVWGYAEWGWRPRLGGRTWGDGYYTDLLPRIVAELDPRTPYSPASPFSYDKYLHPNDPRHGTTHIWDVWNARDYTAYREHGSRFVSEFGFQGPPAWSTLTSVVHDEPLDPYGAQMLVHQKAADGNGKLERGLGDHLPKPESMDDWHWATSLNQARAVAYGIEHFRSRYPHNRGTVVWQLNDQWPVVSWAVVDSADVRKPLWHALHRVYADRLLTVQPRDARPTLFAHNDSDNPWGTELTVTRRSTVDATVLSTRVLNLEVGPRAATRLRLDDDVLNPADPTAEYLAVTPADGSAPDAFEYFVEDTRLRLLPFWKAAAVRISAEKGGYAVEISARSLVKDVTLFPDRLDPAARVDTGLVTLNAGESHTFRVTTAAGLDEHALAEVPVLRSVNDLVAR